SRAISPKPAGGELLAAPARPSRVSAPRAAICEGWSLITRSAACWGVSRWEASVSRSWVHPRSVAEVEADRLHHLERRALGEDVGGREHPGVLLDHGRGCGSDPLFQAALERSPRVVAVLDEVGRQVDGVERLPGALGDVRHVLLVQGNVL